MAAQLHGVDSNDDSSGDVTQEGRVGQLELLQAQMAVTDGRLAAAITAREQAERLLQVSNERSASLEARSCCALVILSIWPDVVLGCQVHTHV